LHEWLARKLFGSDLPLLTGHSSERFVRERYATAAVGTPVTFGRILKPDQQEEGNLIHRFLYAPPCAAMALILSP
jgi:hypothetical protein